MSDLDRACSSISSPSWVLSEAYPGIADVVFRVGKDKVAVSENTNGIDLGSALGKRFQPLAKSRQAICDAQVVLNIFVGIDAREWAAVTRLKTL